MGTTARREEQRSIDPFDPPKAHLLGLLFLFLTVFISPWLAGQLPDIVWFCIAAWVIISQKRASPGEIFRLNKVSPGALAFPITIALILSSAEVLVLEGADWLTRGGFSQWAELFPSPVDQSLPLSEVLSVCVIVPIAEEMFFRGFFSTALRSLGTGWSVVFPAIIFALFHHPVAIGGAFIVALVAGVLTAKHDSILPAIVFHATGNAYMCLLTAVHNRFEGRASDVLYYSITVAGVLLAIKIRPELRRLWGDARQALRDFLSRPELGTKARLLFRHWSYILLALENALTIVWIVATTTRAKPI
ncbi:MAG: CPBP family intramembrane glutamic endopeptidase [Bacillota bacterium]|jgi:membrane protease YdiL (CAAX protease family)|nr:CPBP family intramembrane metalloprotease [Candidatus Fermentithermobacillaceae bacterium]